MTLTLLNEGVRDPQRVARFWAKVDKSGAGCWLWTKSCVPAGYGQFSLEGTAICRAHRFSYALHNGPLSPGQVVRHSCDNPPCVNPAHLVTGSQLDNIGDMHARGRASGGRVPRPGELNPNAKVTAGQVAQIKARRAAGETGRRLAAEFGLSPAQISRIANGKRWPVAESINAA